MSEDSFNLEAFARRGDDTTENSRQNTGQGMRDSDNARRDTRRSSQSQSQRDSQRDTRRSSQAQRDSGRLQRDSRRSSQQDSEDESELSLGRYFQRELIDRRERELRDRHEREQEQEQRERPRQKRMRVQLPNVGLNWDRKLFQWRLQGGNYAESTTGDTESMRGSDLHFSRTSTIRQRPTGAESEISIPAGAPSVISGDTQAQILPDYGDAFGAEFGGEEDYGDYAQGPGEAYEAERLRQERDAAILREQELQLELERRRQGQHEEQVEPSEPPEDESDDDMRPRAPLEQQKPVIYRVDVEELPELDFDEGESVHSEDLMSDGSDDDEPDVSDAGSIAEMIVADSEDDGEDKSFDEDELGSDGSDSDTELFVGDDEDSDDDWRPGDETLAELDNLPEKHKDRPKRHRIPALKFWNNERVEYDLEGKLFLPTAVDVVLVDEPEPVRRRRRRRRPQLLADESEVLGQQEVQAPVYDIVRHRSELETVAKSIRGMPFRSLPDNPRVQVVVLFDQPDSIPIESLVMKIKPDGAVAYDDFQNHAVTFVVWTGRLEVIINGKEFELTRGMACKVPRGNDLSIRNVGSSEAFLLVTEISIQTDDGEDVIVNSNIAEQASIWSGTSFGASRQSWREIVPPDTSSEPIGPESTRLR